MTREKGRIANSRFEKWLAVLRNHLWRQKRAPPLSSERQQHILLSLTGEKAVVRPLAGG